jgi:hypothetical protein
MMMSNGDMIISNGNGKPATVFPMVSSAAGKSSSIKVRWILRAIQIGMDQL